MTADDQLPSLASTYEKYRIPIMKIIEFTDTIDPKYQKKCFEVLLKNHISSGFVVTSNTIVSPTVKTPKNEEFVIADMSSEMKTFLAQYNINEEALSKLFIKENGQIHPIYKITETKRQKAQIQIALLTAFENALRGPSETFEFETKTVRLRCVDLKFYGGRDFFMNFMDSARLFTNFNSYDVIKLSPEGKAELANILAALLKQ
jgi:hypothetical protein